MDHFNSLGSRRSSHSARFDLDRPAAIYRPGEVIAGRLLISAGHGPAPRSITVELQVAAEGEVRSIGVAAEAPLATGAWAPGQHTTHPFALIVPHLPPPFSGALFRTYTRLAAVFDEPGDRSSPLLPVARAFPVMALPVTIEASGPIVVTPERESVRTVRLGPGSGRGLKLGMVGVAIGALLIALGLALTLAFDMVAAVAITLCMFGSLFLLVGGFIAANTAGNWRAERSLGIPSVTMGPQEASGQMFFSVAAQIPRDAAALRAVLRMCIDEDIQVAGNGADDGGWGKRSPIANVTHSLVRRAPGHWAIDLPTTTFEGAPLTVDLFGDDVRWRGELVIYVRGGARWGTSHSLLAFRGEPWAPKCSFSFT